MYGNPEVVLKNALKAKGLTKSDIYRLFIDFTPGVHIQSPFKDRVRNSGDKTPSLIINEYKGELRHWDFGKDRSSMSHNDSVGFVQDLYSIDYEEAVDRIIQRLNGAEIVPYEAKNLTKDIPVITYNNSYKDWELNYWKRFGLDEQLLLKHKVYPLTSYGYNSPIWISTKVYPKYAYIFGEDSWQIYSPLSPKGEKFKTRNIKGYIIGYDLLPKNGKWLVITKSKKDVMCFDKLGLPAIASMNERVWEHLLDIREELDNRFTNKIILFDNDETGKESAKLLAEATGWKNLDINYTKGKDPSDVIEFCGYEELKKLIKQKI